MPSCVTFASTTLNLFAVASEICIVYFALLYVEVLKLSKVCATLFPVNVAVPSSSVVFENNIGVVSVTICPLPFVLKTWFGPTAPSYGQAPSPLAPNGRYFAGGGGGTSPQGIGSPYGKGGGAGGGGSYCNTAPGLSTPGATNTGGGGGGAAAAGTGFAGGSGFVAIRYKFQ